jgi:hypothetical protein
MEHAARLPPEWREAAIAQLARGEIDLKARELQLPAIDEGPSPTTNAATPDEPPTIREPSAMPDFPWCGTGEPTVLIQDPTIGGNGVDACLTWGADCGQPAADEWCRRQGRGPAVYHHIERGPPTQTLRDGKGCSESFCARLTKVVCAASPAVATELAPPAVSICPTLVGVRDSPLDESRHYLITYFGGATMYYPHKSEDILCGYGTITTSQFTGEHLVPEGGGYGLYVMVNGDLRKIAEYAKTGTEIDASGISWDVGKWKDLAKGNAGDWRGRWVAH